MKATSLHSIVYRQLFPNPRSHDPISFSEHLTKNLVPEVRSETAAFYGHLDCAEARYPGLDYSHAPHRMRLGRFVWHRRLFRAFDDLGLTSQEIAALCRWEGTKWARERYELEEGIKVIDTAGMEIPNWVEPRRESVVKIQDESSKQQHQQRIRLPSPDRRHHHLHHQHRRSYPSSHNQYTLAPPSQPLETYISSAEASLSPSVADDDSDADEDEVDAVVSSVGVALNERLRAAAAARERGTHARMDEEWEQWMKDVVERGALGGGVPAELLEGVASSGAAIQQQSERGGDSVVAAAARTVAATQQQQQQQQQASPAAPLA